MSFFTRLRVICSPEAADILIAEVAEAGFDTFQETEDGFEAYANEADFDAAMIVSISERYSDVFPFRHEFSRVEKENWNEQWENSFEPVVVDDRCVVRAVFHQPERQFPHEIVITPKMSFGTGHHQTTWLMLKLQLDLDQRNKDVMDAGCGTAILSIMACQREASYVEAFDIDEWSTENGGENLATNNCPQVRLRQGTIRTLDFDRKFDIILANINKNILLDEMGEYAMRLKPAGMLVLSGFYVSDADDLVAAARPFGFSETRREERESWCALVLTRNG